MPDGRPAARRVRHVRAAASRIAIYTHRWLGISLGVFFIAWFVSGIVLMYAGMPRLTPAETLARTPPLDFSTAGVSVATAATGDVVLKTTALSCIVRNRGADVARRHDVRLRFGSVVVVD